MGNMIVKILIIAAVLNLSADVFAADFVMKNSRDELRMWARFEKMQNAEEMIEKGQADRAIIILEGLIEESPTDEHVKDLKARAEKMKMDKGDGAKQDVAEVVGRNWLEYKKLIKSGDLSGARKELLRIASLVPEDKVRQYLPGFEEEMAGTSAKIEFVVSGKIREIRKKMDTEHGEIGADILLKELVEKYEDVKKMEELYPGMQMIEEMIAALLSEINKSARVKLAQANVIMEFNGCESAAPFFKELLNVLKYPEIETYAKAETELRICES